MDISEIGSWNVQAYEKQVKENAMLLPNVKPHSTSATSATKELRRENARLQQQIASLEAQMKRLSQGDEGGEQTRFSVVEATGGHGSGQGSGQGSEPVEHDAEPKSDANNSVKQAALLLEVAKSRGHCAVAKILEERYATRTTDDSSNEGTISISANGAVEDGSRNELGKAPGQVVVVVGGGDGGGEETEEDESDESDGGKDDNNDGRNNNSSGDGVPAS